MNKTTTVIARSPDCIETGNDMRGKAVNRVKTGGH
jgi:hypothetical protein